MARLFRNLPIPVSPRRHGIAAVEGDVDVSVLARGARRFRIRLPGNVAEDLELGDLARRGPEDVGWRGRVAGDNDSSVSLTLKHGLVFGRLRIGQKVYEVRSRRRGRLVVEELGESGPGCVIRRYEAAGPCRRDGRR